MTTTLVLIASGILIGAGIGVIWRDVRRSRRRAFVLQRDLASNAGDSGAVEAEITISRRPPPTPGYAEIQPIVPMRAPARDQRVRAIEHEWSTLQPIISTGVTAVNKALTAAHLSVGPPGQASWSVGNKGYGAHRRVMLKGESLGWARMELSPEGRFTVSTKAHKDDWNILNGNGNAPADSLTAAVVSDLLSACLRPGAAHAARVSSGAPEVAEVDTSDPWGQIDAIVWAALEAINDALEPSQAQLVTLTPPAWDPSLQRHRMTLGVDVDDADVARMQIERLPHEIEVAVSVRDGQHIDLNRRRRMPVEGATARSLAELIASCAWPAIARFKEQAHRTA